MSDNLFIPATDYIVCDQAYALRTYQICPFNINDCNSPPRIEFNLRLRSARRVIERVFGILKKRWRILTRACETGVDRKTRLVWALIIVHNMIVRSKEEPLPDDINGEAEQDNVPVVHLDDHNIRGQQRRDQLVQQVWQEFGPALQ